MHEIYEIISELSERHPSSKSDLVDFFRHKNDCRVIDSHNTASIIVILKTESNEYAIKFECGQNSATTNELLWYQNYSVPGVRSIFISGDKNEDFSYIVMEYIDTVVSLADAVFEEDTNILSIIPRLMDAFEADTKLHNLTMKDMSVEEQFQDAFNKFETRMRETSKFPYLKHLIESQTIAINDSVYVSPQIILSKISSIAVALEKLFSTKVGVIHGDLHIGNILCDTSVKGDLLLFDPGSIKLLPIHYDGGKILQSVHSGYEQIMRGHFSVTQLTKDRYILKVAEVRELNETYQDLARYWEPNLLFGSLFMEAMHFLTMTPHHASNASEATALYLTGVIRLNELSNLLELN